MIADAVRGSAALTWLLAVSPVVLLFALVLWGRLSTTVNALVTVGVAALVASTAFGADAQVVAVGVGKGAWVGFWILCVIWPALLMHHLASRVGMTELGRSLANVLPRPVENVLLLAWVLPSFLQGVAGFGTPIAICAPLLVAVGVDATRAVALPLIGYHWAVGFGSMGSSFYMGALTAHLSGEQTHQFAGSTSLLLGVNVLVSGVLVTLMYGGWRALRDGWRVLVVVGPAMALAQAAAARGEPAIGALCGGTAGLLAVLALRTVTRRRAVRVPAMASSRSVSVSAGGGAPDGEKGDTDRVDSGADATREDARAANRRARATALPYLVLGVVALAVFLPAALRGWVRGHLLLGPDFPSTATSEGTTNAAVTTYNPIALLGHPGTFLLVATLVSVVVWRTRGVWPRGTWREVRGSWLRQSWKSSISVVLLAAVAGLLVDSGMVRALASGAADAFGQAYPVATPFVGALGSFITGSTTSSNALFAALQHDVALLVGDRPADLLAAQTAGANVGNSLAPVVITIGVVAVGSQATASAVLRRTLGPALVLLVSVLVATNLLVLAHR